ncbi:Putative dipeptidase NECHADRAFT_87110 [Eumeta japonica]|uniref:Dipeptidase n=1 Tax=Eumeta variegata TaxID=151549 RepID=A0A4C1USI5_EUMVA|nr:Putative dipeptidase NECHADRAFT_87110 [Eumeta japonica]
MTNASYHKSAETTRFLEGQRIELTDHPSYNPDLSPNDFYLFPSVRIDFVVNIKGQLMRSKYTFWKYLSVTVAHRRWCCVAALVLVAGTACVAGPLALRAPPGAPLHERLRLADRLLHDTPLVDGHNDLPWNIRKFLHNRIKDFKQNSATGGGNKLMNGCGPTKLSLIGRNARTEAVTPRLYSVRNDISPIEPTHFRAAAELATAYVYHI